MPEQAIEPRDCTSTSRKAAPRLAAALQQRWATSVCWERGPGSKPAPSTQTRGGLTSPVSHSSVCGDKAKNTWANQSQNADCCCILAKKVQSVLQTFCLLTTTKLTSTSSALAQMHPLGTAHLFRALSATLSSEELALPLSSLLFTCASSFLEAFLRRWQSNTVAIPDMPLSKERGTFFYD